MRIAGCESIRQWGFDETKIDGHDTFNQWAMLLTPHDDGKQAEKQGAATIITLECAEVLPSLEADADAVVLHIEEVWRRGKEAVDPGPGGSGRALSFEEWWGESSQTLWRNARYL